MRNRRRRSGYGGWPGGMQAPVRASVTAPEVGLVNQWVARAQASTARRWTGVKAGVEGGTGGWAGAVDHSAPAAFGVAGGVW